MNPIRTITAILTAIVSLALLAFASAIHIPAADANEARLRLSISARPEQIEICRTLSTEELEALAPHMRQSVQCEGVPATYTLQVAVDGDVIDETVVRGAGLRHDRPLYLLEDYSVPPGEHRFRVSLVRREETDDDAAAYADAVVPAVDTGLYAGRAQREASERARRAGAAVPSRLIWEETFVLPPLRVALIRFNSARRMLELTLDDSPP